MPPPLPPPSQASLHKADQAHYLKHLRYAGDYYQSALKANPNCAAGANGLGTVLLERERVDEAAIVFSRVREAAGTIAPTTTARDASLNLAHAHLLQKRFVDAASIYQSVLKTAPAGAGLKEAARGKKARADPRSVGAAPAALTGFAQWSREDEREAQLCAGYAHYADGQQTAQKDKKGVVVSGSAAKSYRRSAKSLSHLLHARPGDLPAWYNLAIVLESWAVRVLTEVAEDTGGKRHKADGGNERRSLKEVEEGVENIRHARSVFGWLGEQGEQGAAASGAARASKGAGHALPVDLPKIENHKRYCDQFRSRAPDTAAHVKAREEQQRRTRQEQARALQATIERQRSEADARQQEEAEQHRARMERAKAKTEHLKSLEASWREKQEAQAAAAAMAKSSKSRKEKLRDQNMMVDDDDGDGAARGAGEVPEDSDDDDDDDDVPAVPAEPAAAPADSDDDGDAPPPQKLAGQKRSADDDDDDDDEMFGADAPAPAPSAAAGGIDFGSDDDDDDAPAKPAAAEAGEAGAGKRRRVMDDEDEDD